MKLSAQLKHNHSNVDIIQTGINDLRRIEHELEIIHRRWPNLKALQKVEDAEKLCRTILARLKSDQWDTISWGKICLTVRALFSEDLHEKADFQPLKKFLIEILSYNDVERPFYKDVFARLYLETFDPDSKRTRDLAEILKQHIHQCSPSLTELFKKYNLLNFKEAAQNLSVIFQEEDPNLAFEEIGLISARDYKIVEQSYFLYLRQLSNLLAQGHEPTLNKLFSWLAPAIPDKAAMETVKTILTPWLYKEPKQELKDLISENLVTLYDDPRLSRSGVWTNMSPALIDKVCAWLTKTSLSTFLDIVDKVVQGTSDAHMWPERRKFWERLFNNGRIDEAWVALSERGRFEQQRQNQHKKINLKSARTHSNSTDKDKCLLILRCGNLIVVEGSHNYMVRIFKKEHPKCPRLYQPSYDLNEIRALEQYTIKSRKHLKGWENAIEMVIAKGA